MKCTAGFHPGQIKKVVAGFHPGQLKINQGEPFARAKHFSSP